ncbi:MAG: DUF2231 domain-containing protein [Balneolaceae bacterium]
MLPDWIPNIHPFVVHFPIALLVVAVLFDLSRLWFREQSWLHNAVIALYTIGTIGLGAAFWSGRQAVQTVAVFGDAVPVVTSHEDWALYTLIFFGIFTAIRLWVWWQELDKGWLRPALMLPALIGTGMLWHTGELGAELVYKHGVAVAETSRLSEQIENLEQRLAAFREEAGPELQDDGSWIWRIVPGADEALAESFTLDGADRVQAAVGREDGRNHLELIASDEPVFVITGGNLPAVDGRAEINVSELDGDFLLVHHYLDRENYQYIRLTDGVLQQGQMVGGTDNVLGSGRLAGDGWITVRVTAAGQHFYGYQNQNTVVHTHAGELAPGRSGFGFTGSGVVMLRMVEFGAVQ